MSRTPTERSEQLLRAAATCFARRGFHPTSMDEIAREAGVSAGLIYRHFANKEALVVAIVQQHRDAELARVRAAAQRPSLATALDALFSPAPPDADLRGEGLVYAEIVAEALRNPRIEGVVRAGDDAVRDALAALLAAAQARGEIDAGLDPLLAAELLTSLREGMQLRSAFASGAERDELAALWAGTRRLCERMLGRGPGENGATG